MIGCCDWIQSVSVTLFVAELQMKTNLLSGATKHARNPEFNCIYFSVNMPQTSKELQCSFSERIAKCENKIKFPGHKYCAVTS